MVPRFLQGEWFMLLVLILAVVVYSARVYRQTGRLLLSFPGVATTLVLENAQGNASPEPTIIPVTLKPIQEHFGVPLPPKLPQQVNPSGGAPTQHL